MCFSVITEFYKQNLDSILRIAEIVDDLSKSITFIESNKIFDEEIKKFVFNFFKIDYEISIFVNISGYLQTEYSLTFDEKFSDKSIIDFNKNFNNLIKNLTYKEFVLLCRKAFPHTHYLSKSIKEIRNEIYKNFNANIKKIRRNEQEFMARQFIIPKLNFYRSKFPIYKQLEFVKYIKNYPKGKSEDSLNNIIKEFKAISTFVDLMVYTSKELNRNDKMNDFYDIDFLIMGLSYADILVSNDSWINDIVTNRIVQNKNEYFKSLDDFYEYIKTIKNHY